MPIFWNAPYRTPYDDALTAYDRVRLERDSPIRAFLGSRLFAGLVPVILGLAIFFLYANFTKKIDQIFLIPQKVEDIDNILKDAVIQSTILDRNLTRARKDITSLQSNVSKEHENTRTAQTTSSFSIVQSVENLQKSFQDALIDQQEKLSNKIDDNRALDRVRQVTPHSPITISIAIDSSLNNSSVSGQFHSSLGPDPRRFLLLVTANNTHHLVDATWLPGASDSGLRLSKDLADAIGIGSSTPSTITLLLP